MKLVLIDDQGNVIDVTEDIQDYDLSKPTASSTVMEDIRRALNRWNIEHND